MGVHAKQCFTLKALLLFCVCLMCAQASPDAASPGRHTTRKLAQKASPKAPASEAPAARSEACCAKLAAVPFSSTLPVLIINTRAQAIPDPDAPKIPVAACTCSTLKDGDYDGTARLGLRGSSSLNNVVKSYGITLDTGFDFLSHPKGKKWALYGPQNDTMGFRNWLAMRLARKAGGYAARTQYFELFIVDGDRPLAYPADYRGLYLAMESIERDSKRVDIQKGGYILDYEHGKGKVNTTQIRPLAKSTMVFLVREPGTPTTAQVDYIVGYLNDLETALLAPNYADPQQGFRKYVNESSVIDKFLHAELTKNPDAYRGSNYFYKDVGGPLNFGPPWDYDEAFGACCGFPVEGYDKGGVSGPGASGGSAISPQGWRFTICGEPGRCVYDPLDGTSGWHRRMWQDPAFRRSAALRYQQVRSGPWADAAVSGDLKDEADQIHDAAMRTFERWREVDFLPERYSSYEDQYTRTVVDLTAWTTARLGWLDSQFEAVLATPDVVPDPNTVTASQGPGGK